MTFNLNDFMGEVLNKPENAGVKKRLDSYQFKLSQQILESRVHQQLSIEDAAMKAGLGVDEYLGFEHGTNLLATKEEYGKVMDRVSRKVTKP